MGTIVQKYGGSSVATPELIKKVAARVVETHRQGHRVVAVVSAMGKTTDELLGLARSVSANPDRRELDMLVTVGERISMALLTMAVTDLGYPAVSFTGSQSGIITTHNHTNARIIRVTPMRIQEALDAGRIVIVAGFQGVSEQLEITSLGRGGSDTTAVALGAALGADHVEICSDVDGIYSADPRVVSRTLRIDELDYEQTQDLADAGAKVLNAEAVEWARRNGIEIACASTHGPLRAERVTGTSDGERSHEVRSEPRPLGIGTRIRATSGGLTQPRVAAVTAHPGIFYLEPARSGSKAPDDLESTLAAHGAPDAWIWRLPATWAAVVPRQNIHSDAAFRVALAGAGNICIREDLELVTVVGRALASPPNLLGPAGAALDAAGVRIHGRLLNAGRVGYLVQAGQSATAVRALHAALIEPAA